MMDPIKRAGCRGMTLPELVVSSGLGVMVLAGVIALISFSARSFAAVSNYVDLDTRSRNALDKMSREIRQSDGLATNGFSPTQLLFTGKDPVTLAPYTFTYTFDPEKKTLTRSKGGQTETLLTQCDSLTWTMYQRNMTNGTDEPIPTSDAVTCKLIRLNWACSRNILGQKANTESVQSAEIVVRKK